MADGDQQQLARRLAAVAFAITTAALPAFLIGSQGVQLRRDLGFDLAALGVVIALAWVSAALTSALMGRVCERLGGGPSLRIAVVVSGITQLLVAWQVRSLAGLAAAAVVAGLANALSQPGANLLLTRIVHDTRHGLAFAVKQSAMPLAALLGGLAVPTLTLTVGWRWTFVGSGVLALVSAVLVPVRAERVAVVAAERTVPRTSPPQLRSRLKVLLVLAAGVAFGAAAAGGLAGFLTSGAVAAGVAEGTAGLLLTLGSAMGIASRLTVGALADRSDREQLPVVATMMAVGATAFVVMALQQPMVYLLMTPLAFGVGWAWPGLFNLSVVRSHADAPAAATGITQTGTYLGAGLGPFVFGLVADDGAFGVAWIMAGGWLLLGAGAILVAHRIDRPAANGAAPDIG